MRAALLLVILALPAVVRAQVSGVVEPQPVDDQYAVDRYINLAECDPAQNVQIEYRWNVLLESGASFRSGVFRFFATNKQPSATTGSAAYCPTEDDAPNAMFAGQVGDDIPTRAGGTVGNGTITTSEIVTEANRTCAVGGDLPIYVCVHYHPYTTGTAVDPTPRGLATGTLTLSTQAPGAPRLDAVNPGNERLEARWTQGSGAAEWFRIVATATAAPTAGDPLPPTRSDDAQGDRGFVDDLVNGATYDVTVSALSAAGNPSPDSNVRSGTPVLAFDFWDRYDGQEQGGCGAGGAGPLALLGLAAALAALRAGRRS